MWIATNFSNTQEKAFFSKLVNVVNSANQPLSMLIFMMDFVKLTRVLIPATSCHPHGPSTVLRYKTMLRRDTLISDVGDIQHVCVTAQEHPPCSPRLFSLLKYRCMDTLMQSTRGNTEAESVPALHYTLLREPQGQSRRQRVEPSKLGKNALASVLSVEIAGLLTQLPWLGSDFLHRNSGIYFRGTRGQADAWLHGHDPTESSP